MSPVSPHLAVLLAVFWLAAGCDAGQCPPHPVAEGGQCSPPARAQEPPGEPQGECVPATADLAPGRHLYAEERLEVARVSFSSCHVVEDMDTVATFWEDMRAVSRPDLWLWLGDQIYKDGSDLNAKVTSSEATA